ncbi:MAG: D-tyrosyl-tRNA(Tyr) deacylase [Cryomorphaceae bacterium]|nr:MAG: D-tyrosyl-tRNA(Tyr) deacylase [Cryomorphaceae bacterium]
MRAVIQRVAEASVQVENQVVGAIGKGLLILLGIEHDDDEQDAVWLAEKIAALRIFSDTEGKMNASIGDVEGEALVISQFTLHAKTKKGNRPSFIRAAKPDHAVAMYEQFVAYLEKSLGKPVQTGSFGAMMQVSLVNHGPVTIWIDTKNKE